jgi:hypothetical protein
MISVHVGDVFAHRLMLTPLVVCEVMDDDHYCGAMMAPEGGEAFLFTSEDFEKYLTLIECGH